MPGTTLEDEAIVSGAPLDGMSFARRIYASTAVVSCGLIVPASSGGMVLDISSSSSESGRGPQVLRKFGPASSGASNEPLKSARWQTEQLARYTAWPWSACAVV
jgi:hypothetical protein